MTQITLIITEKIENYSSLGKKLSLLKAPEIDFHVLYISAESNASQKLLELAKQANLVCGEIKYPEDETLQFNDILKEIKTEYLAFFLLNIDYPNDFFLNIFNPDHNKKINPKLREEPLLVRTLRAVQQSKYGMGVLKRDIKREYPELSACAVYKLEDIKNISLLETEVDENLAKEVDQKSKKLSLKRKGYSPDYSAIEYFTQTEEYLKAIRIESIDLNFRNKENATGLPFYMVVSILISLLMSLFLPKAILPLLVLTALYLLMITLEALAISTIKKQGELFIGLLIFLPFLHVYYLLGYLSQILKSKK